MDDVIGREAGDESYVLLTAAFNEEAFLAETIKSVLAQQVLPNAWVIVSDGSTDQTDKIILRYALKYPFIRFVRREKDQNRAFASKVLAFRAGLQFVNLEAIHFIGHLDADISLPPFYFGDLIRKFQQDSRLGIAGGWYLEKTSGQFRLSQGNSLTSVPGAIQMFRRACYQDIGGLLLIEHGGEDWYAEIMARKCGWRVRSFPELTVRHLRETGTAAGKLRYSYRQGFADFSLGSHPLFELAKVAKRIVWRPYVVGALARLSGFLMAHIYGKRVVPPDFIAFLRKEQTARLLSGPFLPLSRRLRT